MVDQIREEVSSWRQGGYAGASDTSKRLLEHWFHDEHQTADGAPFRYYFAQREAVETAIYLYEVAKSRMMSELVTRFAVGPLPVEGRSYPRYVFKAATGSGKTKVMSLLIAWAYFHKIYEPESELTTTSLVVAPNLIVYERLRADFEAGKIFREDPVIPPEWRHEFDLLVSLRNDPVSMHSTGALVLTNVQALYERTPPATTNPVDLLLGPRPPKNRSQERPALVQLASRGRVLVVNDEAHHLHDQIKRDTGEELTIWQSLGRLHELADEGIAVQLDFSATPRNQNGRLFDDIVADYPLAQAIEDGIVKRPIIGELSGEREAVSDDAAIRYQQRIGAGVAKWREFRRALEPAGKKPLLFIMAESTVAADQIARYLETISDLTGRVLTIHVNMGGKEKGQVSKADLEQARRWAREVDSDDSPYSAIVSVLMLREGWDVRNVNVIVPLRPLTAKAEILPEQTLGRGLRRMTPPWSGFEEQVVIIEHEAFRRLWDEALHKEDDLSVERRAAEDVDVRAAVIAVEPSKLEFDIEIPQLTRVLARSSSELSSLRPSDVPERRIPLKGSPEAETVKYTGRDLLTGKVVERAEYPLPVADHPQPVLAWFANELARETRVVGQFAVLLPLVKGYIEERIFGRQVNLADPQVLATLREPAVQEIILTALRQAVDERTLTSSAAVGEPKPLLLSRTRPFLWSREIAVADKSIFSAQPCDSGFEVQFCGFLDRSQDVAAFAKLAREVRFSLEYRAEGGRLAYYYPDFVVRLTSGACLVVETKGLADLDVPHKDERAVRWASDATAASGVQWSYLRVDESLFARYARDLRSMEQLADLVYEHRRAEYLRSRPAGRKRSREELLSLMSQVSDKTRGVTGVDEEIRRLRDETHGW
ncbi:DEAD/DEAH box helicase family protein [Saccharothrix sp. 6-C]|uniref:DEAD/DEAH box helicase family protein n=1 Tax=Saccharothrix sp. 6-C TaxID=2781735 RepID=UPI001916ED10|nr:DEAD/DEAH box helicase family protein [Saccharothrix sp. 6-C]QQQ75487.1 DEAD/DEAH box helicase family protein [Saccharothrix sp. 6-C]